MSLCTALLAPVDYTTPPSWASGGDHLPFVVPAYHDAVFEFYPFANGASVPGRVRYLFASPDATDIAADLIFGLSIRDNIWFMPVNPAPPWYPDGPPEDNSEYKTRFSTAYAETKVTLGRFNGWLFFTVEGWYGTAAQILTRTHLGYYTGELVVSRWWDDYDGRAPGFDPRSNPDLTLGFPQEALRDEVHWGITCEPSTGLGMVPATYTLFAAASGALSLSGAALGNELRTGADLSLRLAGQGEGVTLGLVTPQQEQLAVSDTALVTLTYRTREALALASPTSARVDLSALFSDTLTLSDPAKFALKTLLAESITVSALTTEDIYRLALATEALQVSEAVTPLLSVGATAQDVLTAQDRTRFTLASTLTEAATLTDTAAWQRLLRERLQEALGFSEDLLPTITIAQSLLETLVAADVINWVKQATASEVLTLADELTQAIVAQLTAPETLNILDEVASSLVVLRTASEHVDLDETLTPSITVSLLAGERLAFIGKLPLGEEVFSAWVLNTDTLGATSYTQFPMLSIATHQGRTFGITETGLYELTGDTDDGEPIPAAIETGALDFALHQDKNIPRAYLYLWAEGTMRLRTVSSKRGCREEAWYEVTPMIGDDEQARIVRLARGVRGTTWQFRIENVDGCDFDLRGAEVLPVVLNKRGART